MCNLSATEHCLYQLQSTFSYLCCYWTVYSRGVYLVLQKGGEIKTALGVPPPPVVVVVGMLLVDFLLLRKQQFSPKFPFSMYRSKT
ncbi:hypothetical protein HUJ05_002803 [Dendroctonus ponderosae]|nr:hypothetical protein HUJ05_002803 [Dendroctonus ponderosae]